VPLPLSTIYSYKYVDSPPFLLMLFNETNNKRMLNGIFQAKEREEREREGNRKQSMSFTYTSRTFSSNENLWI